MENDSVNYFLKRLENIANGKEEYIYYVDRLEDAYRSSSSLEDKGRVLALYYKVRKETEETLINPWNPWNAIKINFAERVIEESINFGEVGNLKIKPFTGENRCTISFISDSHPIVKDFEAFLTWFRKEIKDDINICFKIATTKTLLKALIVDQLEKGNTDIPGIELNSYFNTRFLFTN